MTRHELFELYQKVQRKDREAEKQLIAEHKKKFPRHIYHQGEGIKPGQSAYYRGDLHAMYVHLTK